MKSQQSHQNFILQKGTLEQYQQECNYLCFNQQYKIYIETKQNVDNFMEFLNTLDLSDEETAKQQFKKEIQNYQDQIIFATCPQLKEMQIVKDKYKKNHNLEKNLPKQYENYKSFQYSNVKNFYNTNDQLQQIGNLQGGFPYTQQYQQEQFQEGFQKQPSFQQKPQQQQGFQKVAQQDKLIQNINILGGIEDTIGTMEMSLRQNELSNYELYKTDKSSANLGPQPKKPFPFQFNFQQFDVSNQPYEAKGQYQKPLLYPEISQQGLLQKNFNTYQEVDPFLNDPAYRFKYLQQSPQQKNLLQQQLQQQQFQYPHLDFGLSNQFNLLQIQKQQQNEGYNQEISGQEFSFQSKNLRQEKESMLNY